MRTDFLVIGSGIAGLSFALKTAKALPKSKVTIICKGKEAETNTQLAQGGIAVVLDKQNDSFEKHVQDTLIAGDGMCDKKVVSFVIREGPKRLNELIQYGAKFDETGDKNLDLAKEGGHSLHRVVHSGDFTGQEIQQTLLRQVKKTPNIDVLTETIAIDLITDRNFTSQKKNLKLNTCYGIYALDQKTNRVLNITAKITLLATGGLGQVYKHTTNSAISTGDGVAMAYRAGAKIKNMAFVQFHPTALYEKNQNSNFLISEAVRGFGAILRDPQGRAFMDKYDPRKELATRDIVARAIDTELKKSSADHVFLDCRTISKKEFVEHFPTIHKKCLSIGIDPSKSVIPVVPSAHYCCGGIATNDHAETNVKNLYACGECAYTGLHGSNRLASNSLLEALVFSHRAFESSKENIRTIYIRKGIPALDLKPEKRFEKDKFVADLELLKKTMSNSSGITTTFELLSNGIKTLTGLKRKYIAKKTGKIDPARLELVSMITAGLLILRDAKKRKQNKGVYYNKDLCKSFDHSPHIL